jgi:hypothetical protein
VSSSGAAGLGVVYDQLQTAAAVAPRQQASDSSSHQVVIDWASKKRRCARCASACRQKQIVRHCYHEDGYLSRLVTRSKSFDELDSVQPRQFVIRNHEIRSLVADPGESQLGAIEIFNSDIRIDRLDYLPEYLSIAFDIIDNSD